MKEFIMKKVKIFLLKKGHDKDEAEINAWLAQNPQICHPVRYSSHQGVLSINKTLYQEMQS
jgi:hypothetical protein